MKLFLLRHGQSMGNAWSHAYRDPDTNFLTRRGIIQSQNAAYLIKDELAGGQIDALFTSEIVRAKMTATVTMQELDDWRRIYPEYRALNEWGMYDEPDLSRNWYEQEPEEKLLARVTNFYDALIGPMEGYNVNVLIVSHYYTIQAMINVIAQRIMPYDPPELVLDPFNNTDIPNALPWLYNDEDGLTGFLGQGKE